MPDAAREGGMRVTAVYSDCAALEGTTLRGLFCLCPLYAPQSTAEILLGLGYDAEKSVWLLGMVIRQGHAVGFPAHQS
jgi:hypothetical protein